MPDVNLHDIAPRLAKARDQRLAEMRIERINARMRAMTEMINAMGKVGVRAEEAVRAFGEAWAKAFAPPRRR